LATTIDHLRQDYNDDGRPTPLTKERLIAKCCVPKPCLVQKPREKEGEREKTIVFKMKIKNLATASFDIIFQKSKTMWMQKDAGVLKKFYCTLGATFGLEKKK